MSASSYFPPLSPDFYKKASSSEEQSNRPTYSPASHSSRRCHLACPHDTTERALKKRNKTFKFHLAAFDNISLSFFLDSLVH